jgi:SAM-dependent methyltransferase
MDSSGEIVIAPGNADTFAVWDGPDGEYWADHEDYFAPSLRAYDAAFLDAIGLDAIGLEATDRVLDIGCGSGPSSLAVARRVSGGHVLGVDLSSAVLDQAREHAAEQGLTNVTFLQADAQAYPFDAGSFDVVISRTGCMFFADPVAAFTNIHAAVRPGGSLTLLVWQSVATNEWFTEFARALAGESEPPSPPPGAPGPFAFGDPARVRDILGTAGFDDIDLTGLSRPMFHGPTADAAFASVSGLGFVAGTLRSLDDSERARALQALRASIDAHTTDDGVSYDSAMWIVTARRP